MDGTNMCFEISAPHADPCQHTYSSPAVQTPDCVDDAPASPVAPFPAYKPSSEEPLYTEINIPMPALPSPKPAAASLSPPPASRSRARSLSALSPFHRRSSSSSTASAGRDSEEWPRIRKEVKNKEVAALMNLSHKNKRARSGTIDALAVVPTVLVLSAELFTPGQEGSGRDGRKDSGVGKWEDSIR